MKKRKRNKVLFQIKIFNVDSCLIYECLNFPKRNNAKYLTNIGLTEALISSLLLSDGQIDFIFF